MGATTPLDGIRVVEIAHVASGPYCGMLLADLGADVVKVEPPDGGDTLRKWPPFVGTGEERVSAQFASLNRNKRSVVADLKSVDDLQLVKQLCLAADVVIENYRPGVLDRLGLGYREFSETHRGVVYCSISGFGQTSPYRTSGAYDIIVQAMSGLMSVTGEKEGRPLKSGVPFGDFVAGLYAALCIAAMLPKAKTGSSSYVDVPMLDCLLAASPLRTSEYFATGVSPGLLGNEHPTNVPYQSFQASDGPFVIAAGNDRLWMALCNAIEEPSLGEDARFDIQERRVRNRVELTEILQTKFETRPRNDWLKAAEQCGVPCGPINTFAEILQDRHTVESNLLLDVDVPGGKMSTVAFPCRISGMERRYDYGPPLLDLALGDIANEWAAKTS